MADDGTVGAKLGTTVGIMDGVDVVGSCEGVVGISIGKLEGWNVEGATEG